MTLPRSTPLVAAPPASNWLARPTPTIEPISVCELDDGRPSHQVPRFQMMAASSKANTMARPADELTCKISSTGSSETMPQATAPLAAMTPRKLKKPDHTTAACAGIEWV